MTRAVLVLFLFMVFVVPALPQTEAEEAFEFHTRRGIDYVYNLEFENADREFREMVRLKPQHPAGHFFLVMVQWWRILTDIDNDENDNAYHESLDGVIELCDAMLKRNPNDVTALFFKGGSIGYQGRLRTHRSQWLAAANAGRKALPIVQEASSLDPNNFDILLGSGIYNYYAEIVPREYPFVKPLMLFVPPGDRKKGIEQLTAAAERGKYANIESSYFLMQLYYQFEKDYPKALEIAKMLHERFPNNMLFHKYLGRCYMAVGNWHEVGKVFAEVSARARQGQRGYDAATEREAEYYLGMYAMTNRDYDLALKHFRRCDQLSRVLDKDEASGFMVMANLKVGHIYDLQAKRESAVAQYRKVLEMKEYRDSYKQARQFLKSPYF